MQERSKACTGTGFEHYVIDGIRAGRLSSELRNFDLTRLAAAMKPARDAQFQYLGLQAIYDRYLIHDDGRRIETPQYFWMRVAMGLALSESSAKSAPSSFRSAVDFRFHRQHRPCSIPARAHPQLLVLSEHGQR